PSLSRQTLRPGNGLRFAIAHHPRYALPRGRITCTFPPRRGPAPRYPRSSPATRTTFPYRLVPEQKARAKSPSKTPDQKPEQNAGPKARTKRQRRAQKKTPSWKGGGHVIY